MTRIAERVTDATMLTEYVERVLPLSKASLADEYFYQSLPLCVIDAIFSIGVRYSGTRQVVMRYCEFTNQPRIRVGEELPPIADQESVSTFCTRPEQTNPTAMADLVYCNHQRTSSKSGILKSDAVRRFADCLRSHGVEYLQDVRGIADSAQFEADIRAIPGQSSGISLQYFWMLTGSDQFVKPDRMVLRFLHTALCRTVTVQEATPLLRAVCQQLVTKYPDLTPRLLDHEIWKHQRASKTTKRQCR